MHAHPVWHVRAWSHTQSSPMYTNHDGVDKKESKKKRKKKKIIKERLGVDDQHNQIERSIIMSTGRAQGTFKMHNE